MSYLSYVQLILPKLKIEYLSHILLDRKLIIESNMLHKVYSNAANGLQQFQPQTTLL
jgi:hypothetical protein